MKSSQLFFSVIFSSLFLVACVSAESEMLKQARTIQNDLLNNVSSLDSTMSARLVVLNEERGVMSADTTLSTDSLKMQQFMMMKEKIDNLDNLKSALTDWKSNMKLLPSVEEMGSGAENPFGEKAKDQEILQEIKKSQEDFNTIKMKAEAAMK
jgi:hypothetical protein